MKKLFSFFIASMLVGEALAYDFKSGKLCYSITSDSTVEVSYEYWSDNYYGLTDAKIPESVIFDDKNYSVTSIGWNAFGGCSSLVSVFIPNSVTTIEVGAFRNCNSLTSVIIPNTISSIGQEAFYGCNNLNYNSYDNAFYLGNEENPYVVLYMVKRNNITSCDINSRCHIIYAESFYECTNLTEIYIPDSVVSIGSGAFAGCNNFTSIEIKSNADFDVAQLSFIKDGIAYTVLNKENVEVSPFIYADTVVIPETVIMNDTFSVVKIGVGAFSYYEYCNLRSVYIPNSINSIDDWAFLNCSQLGTIIIPNSVENIGDQAFRGCNSLTSIYIPNSVKSIGEYAFGECKALTEVVIGKSIDSIGNLFNGCKNISLVIIYNIIPPIIIDDPFPYNDTIYVPAEAVEKYRKAALWKHKEILPLYEVKVASFDNTTGIVQGDSLQLGDKAISITATPKTGYHFTHWSDGNTDIARILSVSKNTNITAYFAIDTFDIVLNVNNNQFGFVSGTARYTYGSKATIEATPATNYHFIKWSDDVTDSLRTFMVDCNLTLTAFFEGDERTASFTAENGNITSNVSVYNFGDTITLTATPNTDFHFVMWSDSTIENPRNYYAIDDTSFSAIFEAHTVVVDSAVVATCTATGLTEGSHCSVCGEVIMAQTETPKAEHTATVDPAIPPTCTEMGLGEGMICSVCGDILVRQQSYPALGHEFVNYVYNNDATTEADGTETAVCERGCGATDTRVAEGTKLATTTVTDNAANALNIYTYGKTIVIENATDEIRVYDAMGRIVGRDIARIVSTIKINNIGIYIVKTGNAVKRVLVN